MQGLIQVTGIWTEEELQAWRRREQRLIEQESMNEAAAAQLADGMQSRDRDLPDDDRRICPECRHWQGRRCKRGIKSAPYILQRHDCIEVRGSHQAAHSR